MALWGKEVDGMVRARSSNLWGGFTMLLIICCCCLSAQGKYGGGTGKTTAEMQDRNTFLDAGWDFVGEWAGSWISESYAEGDAAADGQETVCRIVCWNIERLGTRNPRRTQEQISAIARRILTFNASVLALQEIDDVSVLEDVRGQLGASWKIYCSGMENALVYDENKVELLWGEILNNLEYRPYPVYPGMDYSRPVSGVFRPVRMYAEPFRVIGIHCYYGDVDVRTAEGTWLRTRVIELLARPGEGDDIILMGDCNGRAGSPPHPSLEEGNVLYRLDKENGDVTTVNDRQVDHFYVTESVKDNLLEESAFVIRPEHYGETAASFRETYSDHYPVVVDFKPEARTDLVDFADFALHWLETGCNLENRWCYGGDMDGDGEVGLADLQKFAADWLGGVP